MITAQSTRLRVQALASGRGDGGGIAVPLALRVAARIQERDWNDFTCDPTQLANGLRDLVDACAPDGVPVTSAHSLLAGGPGLLTSEQGRAAVEATRRLRASMGDRIVVVACLPGPDAVTGGADGLLATAKEFLAAGADMIVVGDGDDGAADIGLGTLGNVARFHRALAVGIIEGYGLPVVEQVPLDAPRAGTGVVLTDEQLPRDTDISVLEDWVNAVRG